jgi:[acyl-carrier-protein] S-malonyltransferase
VGVTAGHSVGELTAAAIAGALTPEAALVLVRERGQAMAAAAAIEPTGMSAVLGGDPDEVVERLEHLDLTAANHNGAGQIVAAGRFENLDKLAVEPPAGARVRPLAVGGAVPTHHLAPGPATQQRLAPGVPVRDPRAHVLSNADGAVVASGQALLARLVDQVAAPVRWDLCMRTLADFGVTAVIELPPAGTLVGLVRRELKGVETLALKSPAELPAARALVAAQGRLAAEHAPAWRVVVAPRAGTFLPAWHGTGAVVTAGSPVGTVESRGKVEEVLAVHGGTVIEWLAEPGDPVSPGQPLLRLHPEEIHA